ncbi:S9 family peptidase [Alloacidobacterium dinghuense]|uniref:S9 family peptidase n=1 Tax=Alloacidobacterium dinghuense TaxID=2763107 RepID=A0A7G8BG29_9BACT|nr:S9 family peptidase [Alloacidobacterium dinghuense]QNI31499.1 S9 family peptidase [Alloacidobacterium dinghuense]
MTNRTSPPFSMKRIACFIALISITAVASAQLSPQFTTTLDGMMNKNEFASAHFGPARWLHDGAEYTTVEPSKDVPKSDANPSGGDDIVQYETATGKRSVLVSAKKLIPTSAGKPLSIDDYTWSNDNRLLLIYTNSQRVWRQNTRGDYWVLDLASGKLKQLGGGGPESSMMFAKFSPDSRSVAFVRANNIYVQDLATDAVHALTTDGSTTLINGTSDWVNEEELEIRDGFRWSPDSQSIAFWQFDTTHVGEYTLINDTKERYPVTTKYLYPQPGTTNSAVRAGVVSVEGGPARWMQLPGDAREHYIARIDWANSDELIIEYLNRLQNTNQVFLANAKTGEARVFFTDEDKAWVDVVDSFDWIGKDKGLIWLSERDGWRHAYVFSRATGQPQLITNFTGDVISENTVDDKNGWLYFAASPDNATQSYLYRSRLDGSGTPERITPSSQPGSHFYDLSPDGQWAFHRYSTFNHPWVTDLVHLPDHKVVRVLQANEDLTRKVQDLVSSPTEFFKVPVSGGVTLDGWMIRPPNFDPTKKYPVLIQVYGEPASTTVRDLWMGQTRLYHSLIAREGYIVVSFDNQGTPAPKGREWRKVVYGSVGVLSAAQQSDAIRELGKEHSYIDMSRLAVWGWSGGGSNTLNLMFRSPGLFKAGIAVAPVADESRYDTIYQERYMGLPQQNVKGYHDGSPINFAEGLTGHLLVIHGSGDDNVHFQGTELLINRLVELGKPFDFMDYPNRTHGIYEGKGTSFHVYSLIARYLAEHVPPGGVPQ